MKKLKIFNDPIYGFITVKSPLLFRIIEHPYFQRLRRISQMGLSYLVYPGAHHTRFHHALGCTHLMQMAIDTLRMKGIEITEQEEEALNIAILLHDLGHGPFSHALEHSIVDRLGHEEISLRFMEEINRDMGGSLDLAIAIFQGKYHRKFMNQLISSQLDMDRLDYLKRDSFYSGVPEGNINVERLITMLHVKEGRLVLEYKGIYSVEKFIMARRFMYWQVYLHKTGIAAENMLVRILQRAKLLRKSNVMVPASSALESFLANDINGDNFDASVLRQFAMLDDYDVIQAVKTWSAHQDRILSYLCNSLINRRLPKIEMRNQPFEEAYFQEIRNKTRERLQVEEGDLDYLVYGGSVDNQAYNTASDSIDILHKNGAIEDLVTCSEGGSIQALAGKATKYFICYPKKLA